MKWVSRIPSLGAGNSAMWTSSVRFAGSARRRGVVVAGEHVAHVIARLDRGQARPGLRGEERARVGRLLDEVRIVADAVRPDGGLDVGARRAHLGVRCLVE